jgi:hypothetical protein
MLRFSLRLFATRNKRADGIERSQVRHSMRHDRPDNLAATPYGSSLEEIEEGVSAEAVSYAAGLLVEAVRSYDSGTISARKLKLSLTEAQMIAANLIAKASARLDDQTMNEQIERVRKSIREVKPKEV